MQNLKFSAAFGLAGALFVADAAQAQDVGIAASNPGSLYHTTATAVAKMARPLPDGSNATVDGSGPTFKVSTSSMRTCVGGNTVSSTTETAPRISSEKTETSSVPSWMR